MNDVNFYNIIDKTKFDMAMQAFASDILAKMVKILVMCDTHKPRTKNDSRTIMTIAVKKLVEQMLYEMEESFKDVDRYVETGKLPGYMQDIPPEIRDLLEKASNELRKYKWNQP